jgi:hypothetical protein
MEDNIKMDLREVGWEAQTGLIWLRIGTGGRLLCIRWWTFGFHKMRGISWVAQGVLASQEGLCSIFLFFMFLLLLLWFSFLIPNFFFILLTLYGIFLALLFLSNLFTIDLVILGAFRKMRKATISFVCPHETTRLPLEEFLWNLIFEFFFEKICRANSNFIKILQELRVLYMTTFRRFWRYLAKPCLEWEMF